MSILIKKFRCLKRCNLMKNRNEYSTLFIPKCDYLSDDNFDSDYYLNKDNVNEIIRNIKLRRSAYLIKNLDETKDQVKWIKDNIKLLPNRLDARWKNTDVKEAADYGKDQFLIEQCGEKREFNFQAKKAEDIFNNYGVLMLGSKGLGTIGGTRSYLLLDDLVDLKNALIQYTLDKLIKKYQFNFVIVPNLIYNETVNACGFNVIGDRNLVYKLKNQNSSSNDGGGDSSLKNDQQQATFSKDYKSNQVCLSGTSEIPLAGLHFGEILNLDELPIRYCTVSRCYRKEISFFKKESGIYRVHYFDKIEMFGLTDRNRSNELLDEFIKIQKELFNELHLPFKILDMPPHELGNSASCKYDIECYLPGRKEYGEISSTSNCTDFQSRRFNIKYKCLDLNYETNEPFSYDFVHTVNGTACAIPRMLIAIAENNQLPNLQIRIPDVLQPYMNGQELIRFKRQILKKKFTFW